jgi:hypothetical protein
MNCSAFRKKMYLREDELGPDQWKEFQRHRSTCAECLLEYRKVERATEALARIGRAAPLPPDPAKMATSVIIELEKRMQAVGSIRVFGAFDAFIGWLGLAGVRVGIVSLLVFICASFAVEYTSGYIDIEGLENSMTTYSSAQTAGSAQLLAGSDATDLVAVLSKIVVGEKSFFDVSGDWVMINKNSIEKFILLYNDLQSIAPNLPPEFRAAHPELWKLLTQKKAPKDLEAIVKDRKSLIRELNELIPHERKTP